MDQAPKSSEPLNSVLRRNIDALQRERQEEERSAGLQDRIAATISRFAGSMAFVYVHLVVIGLWVANSLGLTPGIPAFDPTFVTLATFASVEAIFLSTFILIAQNRAAILADRRSDLDLQISLLTEHELTRALDLCKGIAGKLGINADPTIEELTRDVAPERVLQEIQQVEEDRDV